MLPQVQHHEPVQRRPKAARRAGRVRGRGWGVEVAVRAGLWVALAVGLWACPAPQSDVAPLGSTSMRLELPNGGVIERATYAIESVFLDADPPVTYLQETRQSVFRNGELVSILPCRTRADGEGTNQINIQAEIFVRGRLEPYEAFGSAVFTCKRNADVPVNIVLNVISDLDAGFADIDTMVGGTLCASKVDMKDDGAYGVCPTAKCSSSEELFLFANTCVAVQADRPSFWVCGDAADWEIRPMNQNDGQQPWEGGDDPLRRASVAYAWFPVPPFDGVWEFGVLAFDRFQMSQYDPSLTDDDGWVRVWAGLAATRALFERTNGETLRRENASHLYDFAAQLTLAGQAPGEPEPELMLLVKQNDLGAKIAFQRPYGPCDQATAGVSLYPGLRAIDVRRVDDHSLRILFAAQSDPARLAKYEASCQAQWEDEQGSARPVIRCEAQTELLP